MVSRNFRVCDGKVYLASPFFNDAQRARERKICAILREAGYDVYAPFEHGIVAKDCAPCEKEKAFKDNVANIQKAAIVVAITDEKDMGTVWEAGFAFAYGIPIVYYAETLGDNPFNIMLGFSGIGVFSNDADFKKAAELHQFTNNRGKVCEAE